MRIFIDDECVVDTEGFIPLILKNLGDRHKVPFSDQSPRSLFSIFFLFLSIFERFPCCSDAKYIHIGRAPSSSTYNGLTNQSRHT